MKPESQSTGHEYPSGYRPGTHWATDAAWEILDMVRPGVISGDVRAYLAGLITYRLVAEREAISNEQ